MGPVPAPKESSAADSLLPSTPGSSLATVPITQPTETADDKMSQYTDDVEVNRAAISSARWAYILFRSPVMVAVHADQMLGSGS